MGRKNVRKIRVMVIAKPGNAHKHPQTRASVLNPTKHYKLGSMLGSMFRLGLKLGSRLGSMFRLGSGLGSKLGSMFENMCQ